MIPRCFFRCLAFVFVSGVLAIGLRAQTLTIQGVSDRANYRDSASFRVATNAGFTYEVTLNGVPVPAGVTNTVRVMDYYDLTVYRSDNVSTNVRFIVESSRRLKAGDSTSPELGLLEWIPLPPIPSTAEEMAGASLRVMTPQDYPAGLEIPVVARVEDAAGNERRVNGWVSATGFAGSNFRILRGVGHGFLPPATPGLVSYDARLQSLQTNKQINIEASTTWTTVSGLLGGTTAWADNSRIHVTGNLTIPFGAMLTIGAGTVVRLNPNVNITNSGRTVINGTITQPVVFTATNRVAPELSGGAWGGWIMRGASSELIATAAIMTGSGADQQFKQKNNGMGFSPGSSHRDEQPLLFAHNSVVRMTNCALINLAGQVGNGYRSSIIWDHCLIQRAITCGEYDGGTNIVIHSAIIEFPSVDGVYNATIADADYDGFYTINTTNYFAHSLFGFCKDDAIDAGSGGAGTVVLTNCWVESALHEALAWSGLGRRTWTYDTVLMNSGQGLECGWSEGADSPLVHGERILSTANCVGTRYGDNYTGTTGLGLKNGFLTATNSLFLYNYRDVWGQVWDNTWNYRVARMDVQDNYLTAPNTNHPNNTVWNPPAHAALLAPLMRTPPEAAVGIGFANWDTLTLPALTNGVPIRLSTFTTNVVSVDYSVQTASATITSGTLIFQPGETVKRITAPITGLGTQDIVRVTLANPARGEVTTASQLLIVPADSVPATNVGLIPFSSTWKYLDTGVDQLTAWRAPAFNDAGWPTGCAEFGYGDGGECTTNSFGPNSSSKYITTYFRKAFTAPDPQTFTSLSLRLLRDDGGVVYVNGAEVLRSPSLPQPPTPIVFGTLATNQSIANAPADNTVDLATLGIGILVPGTNVVAVEIHQHRGDSSDISFNLELLGNLAATAPRLGALRFGSDLVLYWPDPAYRLEASEDPAPAGGWASVANASSPVTVTPDQSRRFYRLKKP